jgi:hypothetical protein
MFGGRILEISFSLLCFHALSFDVVVPSALDYIVTIID